MSQFHDIYKDLTGVQIDQQMKKWDERGKGYYGEYLLFVKLYEKLPGQCKLLMNLQIPAENGKTTEIDLLLIHETGLYVFEAKHYKGTILGRIDEEYWTQYFRTAPNHKFFNSVLQNHYHIKHLQKLCPPFPIRSFIVFTNEDCVLKIKGSRDDTRVCVLENMFAQLVPFCQNSHKCMTAEQIDELFVRLSKYSPMPPVKEGNYNFGFYDFIDKLKEICGKKLQEAENLKQDSISKYRKKTAFVKWLCIILVVLSFAVCQRQIEIKVEQGLATAKAEVAVAQDEMKAAQNKLHEFSKKWQLVTDFTVDEQQVKKDFVSVQDFVFEDSADFNDVTNLQCSLVYNGSDFYVTLNNMATVIVALNDGTVLEYPLFDRPRSISLGGHYKDKTAYSKEFSGFSVSDVKFIKIASLKIYRVKYVWNEGALLDNYEIILYGNK